MNYVLYEAGRKLLEGLAKEIANARITVRLWTLEEQHAQEEQDYILSFSGEETPAWNAYVTGGEFTTIPTPSGEDHEF